MAMVKNKKPLQSADDTPLGISVETVHVEVPIEDVAEKEPPSGFKGTGKTSITHPTGATEETSMETPGAPTAAPGQGPPMAYPSIRLGQTLNLGNYNSLRIEVGLSVPCTMEDLDATYDYAFGWVDERFSTLLDQARESYPQAGK